MGEALLVYEDTPPSMNSSKSGYQSHWSKGHKTKQRWEGIVGMLLLKEKVPRGVARIEATAELRFPDSRRRDAGNFRMVLEKALGDALVKVGIIEDDDSTRYEFGALVISNDRGEKGPACTWIRLQWPEKVEAGSGGSPTPASELESDGDDDAAHTT